MTGLLALMAMQIPALPDPPREFRGVWVATVDNIDWPSKRGLPTERQVRELCSILDKAQTLNLNAVIFQIRPSADALYASKIEPWSEYLTAKQGQSPQPYWDPLQYIVQEGHARGLEVHCWFNPYRSWHPAAKSPKAPNYIGNTNPGIVKTYGTYEWMDPGEPDVQQRSLDVMLDVVKRYDIDGIHIDDYFYPYPISKDGQKVDFPDEPSWQAYKATGGTLPRDEWRRNNVDTFIERLYKGIKAEKQWVKFGISPFGIYRPGVPAGIKAGVDQFAELYADARKWLVEGWCDYYAPQLYWPIAQTAQSYPVLLKWWTEQNPKGRHLWVGNFTGRTNPSDGNWKPEEVVNQIDLTRKSGATGNCHFSMKAFMRNYNGISDALVDGPYGGLALVPPSPWLGEGKPPIPRLKSQLADEAKTIMSWESDEKVRFYLVQALVNGSWSTWVSSSDESIQVGADVSAPVSKLAIRSVDRVGNLSDPLIVNLAR